ncbi:hypothetical protein [Desulfobacter postgatei]|uniref:hypothetical protein n=1 Tax=Desulfobacter postgatei TaxID=2293 RepID=UPI002A368C3C|nr:hypothetical protein [Desulfobacter postgatei]MDX9964516.1 hypothetical protein [Desulfobacter postgatei]
MPNTNRVNFQTGSWSQDSGPTDAATLVIAGDWAPIRAFAPLIESDPQAIRRCSAPAARGGPDAYEYGSQRGSYCHCQHQRRRRSDRSRARTGCGRMGH